MASRVTQPVDDRVFRFKNRGFSDFAWRNRIYYIPVDEAEKERCDDFGELLKELSGGRNVLFTWNPPTSNGNHSNSRLPTILDCGCGSGAWITSFLDEYGSDFDITGIDIFFGQSDGDEEDEDPIENHEHQPDGVQEYFKRRWNLNGRFSDAPREYELLREAFDFINSRFLCEGINAERWRPYIHELHSMLRPGGWLQMVEMLPLIQSDNGSLPRDSCLTRWWEWYSSMMLRVGRNPRIGRDLEALIREAGFADVGSRPVQVPVGAWLSGRESIGQDVVPLVRQMLVSLSVAVFLYVGRMAEDQYRNLVTGACAELERPEYKLYFTVYCVWGRRSRRRR